MFNIPENKLPPCLKDPQRVNVLFAPFRSRSVNPKDWESKISSWKTIIKAYCETNDVYSFTLSYLNEVFIRNGRPPTCLDEVLNDMHKNEEIQTMEEFLRKNSQTWSGWFVDSIVKKPLLWSYNKIKNSVFVFKNVENRFVHLETIQIKSNEVINSVLETHKNKLISLKELLKLLNKDVNSAENIKLLLHYLVNEQKVDVTQINKSSNEFDNFLIKVGDGNKVNPINAVDIGIYTLEQNEIKLSKQIEDMEDEVHNLIKEAKTHLNKNHKQMAKGTLRKKHDLEKRIDKKLNALHNIQTLLEKIRDTHSDADVWKAYKNALSAFSLTYGETGINEDKIEDTMINLGDILEQQSDIETALGKPALESDDLDLEEELEQLMKEEENIAKPPPGDGGINTSDIEKEFEDLTLNLPEIPQESPNVTPGKEITLKD